MPPKKDGAKKGGKGGKGKKNEKAETKQAAPPDEYGEMDESSLQDEYKKMIEAHQELKRKRNYFQLEKVCVSERFAIFQRLISCILGFFCLKDQLQQFYDIAHNETTEAEANLRNVESQMQRMQELHRNNIKVRELWREASRCQPFVVIAPCRSHPTMHLTLYVCFDSDAQLYLQKVIHLEYLHGNKLKEVNAEAQARKESDAEQHQQKKVRSCNECSYYRHSTLFVTHGETLSLSLHE